MIGTKGHSGDAKGCYGDLFCMTHIISCFLWETTLGLSGVVLAVNNWIEWSSPTFGSAVTSTAAHGSFSGDGFYD